MFTHPYSSIPAMVRGSAERFGDAVAFEDHGRAWTFRDIERKMLRAGRALIARGVRPGDRVAVWAPNCVEWVIAASGVMAVGAVVVPINTRFRALEANQILRRSEARVLISVGEFLGRDYFQMILDQDPALVERIGLVGVTSTTVPGVTPWEEFLDSGGDVPVTAVEDRIAAISPNDLSDLMFTSGTTGEPKAVMSSHAGNLFVADRMTKVLEYSPADRCLLFQPMFTVGGFKGGWIASMYAGTLTVPVAVYSSEDILQRCMDQRISICKGPPPFFQDLIDEARAKDLRPQNFRLALIASSGIPKHLVDEVREVLGFEFISTGYGMTESHGTICLARKDDAADSVARSSGRPIPGVEVRVVDEAGRDVPAGERGEILFRGQNAMLGYWQNPEATEETIDADGWVHTGDVGVFTDDGLLDVVDRIKNMFVMGGFNVYPAEVEDLIGSRPDVAEVAVVARTDERFGEVGVAFIVPVPGVDIDADEIISWSRDNMANYKVPREVRIVGSLPRNATMKVVRFELESQAAKVTSEA